MRSDPESINIDRILIKYYIFDIIMDIKLQTVILYNK